MVPTHAQLQEVSRYVYTESARENRQFEPIALQKRRQVLLFGPLQDPDRQIRGSTQGFFFQMLDDSLRPLWECIHTIGIQWVWQRSFLLGEEALYLLFSRNFRHLGILSIHFDEARTEWQECELPKAIDIEDFFVLGKNAYFIGRYKRFYVGMRYSFFENRIQLVSKIYEKWYDGMLVVADPQSLVFHIFLRHVKNRDCHVLLRSFAANGELLNEEKIGTFQSRSLISISAIPLAEGQLFIAATYAFRCASQAEGIAFSRYDPKAGLRLQYMPFYEMKGFYTYLNPKKQNKLLDRAEQLSRKQNKDNPQQHRTLLHQLYATPESIFLPLDVYRNNYRNPGAGSLMRFAGSIWNSTNNLFEYLHGHIFQFSPSGLYQHDYAIAYNSENSRLDKLSPLVRFVPVENGISLMSLHPEGIHLKVIQADTITYEELKLPYQKGYHGQPSEKIRPLFKDMQFWYGPYFLLWYPYQDPFQFNNRQSFYLFKMRVNLSQLGNPAN